LDEHALTPMAAPSRFALEVAKAVVDEIGADRTGIRLSPGATLGGLIADSATFFGGGSQGYTDYPTLASHNVW